MKLTKVLMAVAVLATLIFVSCKPKDADIKATIEAAIKADPMMPARHYAKKQLVQLKV